jgi:CRISPR-associated protein (TIGR02584 family)
VKTRRTRKTTPKPAHLQAGPQPERTPREENVRSSPEVILLAVTGMSPAILTETIWALANPPEETAPIIPHRVIAVTTTEGRSRLQSLFEPSPQLRGVSPWEALRAALTQRGHDLTSRLRFGSTSDDIRVITSADPATGRSRELQDIRNRTDNEAAADFILEQVRAFVENPDTQLIASIAGGRKTMSALLHACLNLLGRETDRLTHVLVSEPFDTLRDFWFPAQPGGPIRDRDGRQHDPQDAVVDLADVPFIPLRNLFRRELGTNPGSFLRLVDRCRADIRHRAAENLRVTIDTARAELEVNSQTFKLAPTEMLTLLFLARRAKHNEPAYSAYKLAADDLDAFRKQQIAAAKDFNDWRYADSLKDDLAQGDAAERFLVKAISNLRDKLRQRGGDAATFAACLPEKGRCSLDIPGSLIFIK